MLSNHIAVVIHTPEYDDESPYFGDISLFYMDSFTWATPRVKGSPPSRRNGHSSCSDDRSLYIYGGEDPLQLDEAHRMCGNAVYKLEYVEDAVLWSQVQNTSNESTKAPVHHGVLRYAFGRLFVFGGTDLNYEMCKELCYFDLEKR